ncbi:MAG: universal stress protein [Deferribacteraceae bacterium]|jgi:nucleotide-binding universal stress UspA family protein|nr:universal stress protein [Deferribacteraceae bacterium]
MQVSKILFPTDFSDASRHALEYAVYLQKMFNAELEIAHVIFDETYLITMYVPQGTLQGFMGELESGVMQHMDKFTSESEILKDVKYTTKILKGTPHAEITKWAEESGVDLIVIGTHGRTGIQHVLFGSTAEKVIGKAHCPVLTVKPS